MREIKIGSIYKHFKNKYYVVVDIVYDCESNTKDEYDRIVIYRALYGEFLTWARPYDMFNSLVDRHKYPDVQQMYRFEEVDLLCPEIIDMLSVHEAIMQSELISVKELLLRRDIIDAYGEILLEFGDIPQEILVRSIYQRVNFDNMNIDAGREFIMNTLNTIE